MGRIQAPYGTWSSPIDARFVAEDSGWPYSLVKVSGGDVYWSESRPAEDGRDALVLRRGTTSGNLLPVRSVEGVPGILDRGPLWRTSTPRTMLSMREPLITATLFSIFVGTRGTAKAIGAIQRLYV